MERPDVVVEDLSMRDGRVIVYLSDGGVREHGDIVAARVRRIGWATGVLGILLYSIIFLALSALIYSLLMVLRGPGSPGVAYILLGDAVALASIYVLAAHIVLPAELRLVSRSGREYVYIVPQPLIPKAKFLAKLVERLRGEEG